MFDDFNPTPTEIDSIISAEIPHPSSPIYERVTMSHLHGYCGNINSTCSCMSVRQCSKGYSKLLINYFDLEDDSFL